MFKPGSVRSDDNGNLHFKFDDGTTAVVYWEPEGELGDGQGGGFDEENFELNDSGLTTEQLTELADTYSGIVTETRFQAGLPAADRVPTQDEQAKLPSQLQESEALAIHGQESTIGFVRDYGRLHVVALPKDADPRDTSIGLEIGEEDNDAVADKLFIQYRELIANRNAGKMPAAVDGIELFFYENCHDGKKIKIS